MTSEIIVEFTRDYELIRSALKRVQHYDKTNLENMLQTVSNILATNWATQNYCQVLIFTDCGIGFGNTSLRKIISNLSTKQANNDQHDYAWLTFLNSSKLNFICIGQMNDSYFVQATQLYQQFLNVSGQKGNLFFLRSKDMIQNENNEISQQGDSNKNSMKDLINRMCETNYGQFEALLICGSYFKLRCPVIVWPPPLVNSFIYF